MEEIQGTRGLEGVELFDDLRLMWKQDHEQGGDGALPVLTLLDARDVHEAFLRYLNEDLLTDEQLRRVAVLHVNLCRAIAAASSPEHPWEGARAAVGKIVEESKRRLGIIAQLQNRLAELEALLTQERQRKTWRHRLGAWLMGADDK